MYVALHSILYHIHPPKKRIRLTLSSFQAGPVHLVSSSRSAPSLVARSDAGAHHGSISFTAALSPPWQLRCRQAPGAVVAVVAAAGGYHEETQVDVVQLVAGLLKPRYRSLRMRSFERGMLRFFCRSSTKPNVQYNNHARTESVTSPQRLQWRK